MNRPVYMITKQCKYRHRPCGKCGFPLRLGRKYVLDPVEKDGHLPKAYHAGCWRVKD